MEIFCQPTTSATDHAITVYTTTTITSTSSPQVIHLSTFDSHYTPRIYMITIIGYSMEPLGQIGSEILLEMLGNMVTDCVKQYPILTGSIETDPDSDDWRVIAHIPDSNSNV